MSAANTVRLREIVIPQREIIKLSKIRKRHYLMLTNILRDLNLLQKILLFIKNSDKKEGPIRAAFSMTLFFFLKLLISKDYEAIRFIEDKSIAAAKSTYSQDLQDKLTAIEDFLSDGKAKKLFRFIRNKFGFHYDTQTKIEPMLHQIMNDCEKIEMWLSEDSANEIFSSSYAIMTEAIFRYMIKLKYASDYDALMDKLFELPLECAKLIRSFCVYYLEEVILRDIALEQHSIVEVEAPLLSEVKLPFIVRAE